ncbi:hypothetical protein L596_023750 [Steinernema carpocapsae]|uniref:Uncharacterized protein n=1 Tax=Steinernema carpocapsae TaxID=34508 RepID=A0A4U5MEM9_STECR|nr:hypothetical protein L596_023750 [Steinernema carpocapsae]
MQKILLLSLLFFAYVVCAEEKHRQLPGTWSEWTEHCTDNCGLCGYTLKLRTCLAGTCVGEFRQDTKDRCAPNLCPHPRKVCCDHARIGVLKGKPACVRAP